MADEQVEAAENEQIEAAAGTEQQETAETVTTEAPAEQAAAETKAAANDSKPDTVTREEAKRLADEAVANLQRQYDAKLQANAHNAKLAETLEKLNDQLSGKKPVDPSAPPEGFDVLPEPLQKHFIAMGEKMRELETAQRENTKKAIVSSVGAEVLRMRSDQLTGKLFASVEDAIARDISTNPHLAAWVRENPKECLDTLFARHAQGKTQEVKAEANKAKVEVAKSVSQRPSQASTATQTQRQDDTPDFDSAFESAWKTKVGAGKNYIDQD